MSPTPHPDDWQQAAAQHRQQQFDANVKRVGKQARTGNRFAGGCLMFFGFLMLVFVPLSLVSAHRGHWEDLFDNAEPYLWLFGGGFVTLAAGWAVWRGKWR
jgi:hypothetical protein